jgi:UDP-glucose 4-epimerase
MFGCKEIAFRPTLMDWRFSEGLGNRRRRIRLISCRGELAASGHEVVIYDSLVTGHRGLAEGYKLIVGDIAHLDEVRRALDGGCGNAFCGVRLRWRVNVKSAKIFPQQHLVDTSPLRCCAGKHGWHVHFFFQLCHIRGSRLASDCGVHSEGTLNPYGETKLFLERALNAYSYSYGLGYVVLRYFNAAGAHPDGSIGEYHDPETSDPAGIPSCSRDSVSSKGIWQ